VVLFKKIRIPSGINVFAVFAFLSLVFTLIMSISHPPEWLELHQETFIYGEYTDSVIPLVLFAVTGYIFLYKEDFNLHTILISVVGAGAVFTAFFITAAGFVVHAQIANVLPVIGLYPLRIGVPVGTLITLDGLFLTVSAVFSFFALLIVYVCCAVKYRSHIMSATVAGVALYSCLYVCAFYVPYEQNRVAELNAPVYEISELVYNSADAPPLYTHDISPDTARLLQFLNQQAIIRTRSDIDEIIAAGGEHFLLEAGRSCYMSENFLTIRYTSEIDLDRELPEDRILVGYTDTFAIFAIGERAILYVLSQE
jgi:hypothetical protein